jgi:signal transduction histidine kinase
MPLRPVDTDAVELARQVVTALAPAAQAAGVLLEAGEPDSGSVPVHVDPHRMLQVLTNLVGNAIKFSGSGSPVTVSATRRHGEVRITVEDRGRGIPPEELGTIFDRFRQVPGDDPGTRAGTGLGLAIAQGMVQRSGGRIDVQSEVGRGSTFNVVLPAAEPTEGDR